MPNITRMQDSVPQRYKDLGDNTYAQVVALDGSVTISSVTVSDVEISNDIGNPIPISATPRLCVGRQTISVTTGSVTTLTVPSGAAAAAIQADGSAISITLDGTTPTATVGSRIDDGVFYYVDTTLANVKLIARTSTTNVQVVYFNKA
jgi:hypothetical protein